MTTVDTIETPHTRNQLPAGWRIVKFGEVVRNVDVGVRNPLEQGLARYLGLEHLDPESLHVRRWGLIAEGTSFTRKFIRGQVLFGKRRAYQRKAAVAEFDGICSGDILVFEPSNDDLLPELLPFIVQSDGFFEHALGTSAGSLSPRTRWRDLAEYEFALPPKDEQRRIAEILWAADEVCQSRKRVLEELSVSRQIVIDHSFSSFDSTQVIELKEVCEMQNGRSFPSTDYRNEGVRLLRPGNLGNDGYFDWREDNSVFLPDTYYESASNYLIAPRDVVINLTAQSLEEGFMGRVCLARDGDTCLLNQRIGRFICGSNLHPEYLFRYLQTSSFRKLVEASCEGSKIKHLYWRHIENFQIAVPPLTDQEQVVQTLSLLDQGITRVTKNWNDSIQLHKILRENLLSGDKADVDVQRS